MTYYVYQVTNKINNKTYIGRTNNIKKRWARHRTYPFSVNLKKQTTIPKLYKAIKKYGINNFEFKIIKEYNNEDDCRKGEIEFIIIFDSIKNGYNFSEGGDGVSSGINHPFYGKKHTPETLIKMSQSKIGIKMGPATKERKDKISKALKGKEKIHTKGENNPSSKLKDSDIYIIREYSKNGLSSRAIANIFKVSATTIKYILNGKIWKHVL